MSRYVWFVAVTLLTVADHAAAQVVRDAGGFTPTVALNAQAQLFVSVETSGGAGRVFVDVLDNDGSILKSQLDFEMEKPGERTLPASPWRPVKPGIALRMRFSAKAFKDDVPVVRAIGIGLTPQQSQKGIDPRMDPVECIRGSCPVCYTLQESAEVSFDTIATDGRLVRNDFHTGRETAGPHKTAWDQHGENDQPAGDGRYQIQLNARNAGGGRDVLSNSFLLPPGAAVSVCKP